jgi:hypothetical protein
MTCIRVPNGIVCVSPEHEVTDANGKTWRFEFHSFLGPTILRKDGQPRARLPGERSPFWPAFTAWHAEWRKARSEAEMPSLFVEVEP